MPILVHAAHLSLQKDLSEGRCDNVVTKTRHGQNQEYAGTNVHYSFDDLTESDAPPIHILGIDLERLKAFTLPPNYLNDPGTMTFRLWIRDIEGRSLGSTDESDSPSNIMQQQPSEWSSEEEDSGTTDTLDRGRINTLVEKHYYEYAAHMKAKHLCTPIDYLPVYSLVVKVRHDDCSGNYARPLLQSSSNQSVFGVTVPDLPDLPSHSCNTPLLDMGKYSTPPFRSNRPMPLDLQKNESNPALASESLFFLPADNSDGPRITRNRVSDTRHSRRHRRNTTRRAQQVEGGVVGGGLGGQMTLNTLPIRQFRNVHDLPSRASRSWAGCDIPLQLQCVNMTFDEKEEKPSWRIGIGIINEHSEVLNTGRYFDKVKEYLKAVEHGDAGLSNKSEPRPGLLKSVLTDPSCHFDEKEDFKQLIDCILESYPSSTAIKKNMPRLFKDNVIPTC